MLIDLPTLALLFAAAFIAGLVDAVAGGGGLITVPALLAAGLPPQMALGTNKLQATFGSGSAMLLSSGPVGSTCGNAAAGLSGQPSAPDWVPGLCSCWIRGCCAV